MENISLSIALAKIPGSTLSGTSLVLYVCFIHLTNRVFIEDLLYGRDFSRHWEIAMIKTQKIPALRELTLCE
jgi:hypothetical protein